MDDSAQDDAPMGDAAMDDAVMVDAVSGTEADVPTGSEDHEAAASLRWKPHRAGILNVWEYDDEVFTFGDGRLVLRGRNGSGKSNALALLFPFLLEGVMGAMRMDPMGGARSMKSLLLGRDDGDLSGGGFQHDSRVGYLWLEFARGSERLTIGAGVSATVHREARAWFFVTDRSVGLDVDLCRDDTPRSKRELTELLGANSVFDTAEQYRTRVDRELFGLGAERQRALTDLLLTLRRPHLAGKLDADSVSATLSAGLPALDEVMLQDVAHSFEDLDSMATDLEGVRTSRATVERFLPSYRRYLLGAGRDRARALLDADRTRRVLERESTSAWEMIEQGTLDLDRIVNELDRATQAQRSAESDIDTIRDSPAYRSSVALAEVEKAAAIAARVAGQAVARSVASIGKVEKSTAERDRSASGVTAARAEHRRAVADWRTTAAPVGLAALASDDDFDLVAARAAVTTRAAEVEDLEIAVTERDRADDAAAREHTRWEAARELVGVSAEALDHRRAAAAEAEARLRDAIGEWTAELGRVIHNAADVVESTTSEPELTAPEEPVEQGSKLDELDVAELATAFDWTTLDHSPILLAVQAPRGVVELAMVEQRRVRAALEERAAELRAERSRIATEPNPGPPIDPTRPDAGSPTAPGVPLYACVDFAPSLSDQEKAGLEAALDAAGLLDARVSSSPASGHGVHDAFLDSGLEISNEELPLENSLRSVLVPVPTDRIEAAAIDAVLRRLPFMNVADRDALVAIGSDGRWRLGPVSGYFAKERAEFVGHEARERRRAIRLVELDASIQDTTAQIERREQAVRRLGEVLVSIREALDRAPSVGQVETLRKDVDRAIERVAAQREQEAAARRSSDEASSVAADRSIRVQRIGSRLGLDTDRAAVRAARSALFDCDHRLGAIEVIRRSLAQARSNLEEAERRLEVVEHDADEARREAAQLGTDAQIARDRFELLRADVSADAEAAVAALAEARTRLEQSRTAERTMQIERRTVETTIATQTERVAQIAGQIGRALEQIDLAAQRVATVARPEVLDVLGVTGIDEAADPLELARVVAKLGDRDGLSTDPDPVSLPEADAANQMERAYRTILLDGLRDGHEPTQHKIDGLDLVRVGTTDGDVPIGALARQLAESEARLGQLLTAREREIFETHLLTRVADGLRHLLLDADDFERRINAELTQAPTSSQMRVELRWRIDSDEPGVAEAVKLLRFSADTIGPQQREELRTFFTDRIALVRTHDQGRSFQEVLVEALDYRRWHRYELFARFSDGARRPITRTLFRSLSGGEAATVLHLPLFAAAAAHYSSGTVAGPRMIALDEAFAGIDDQTRGRLMGLLVQLDLDMLLTSHELWGTYGEVPELSIYDLNRKPPTPGVFARHIAWRARTGSRR